MLVADKSRGCSICLSCNWRKGALDKLSGMVVGNFGRILHPFRREFTSQEGKSSKKKVSGEPFENQHNVKKIFK